MEAALSDPAQKAMNFVNHQANATTVKSRGEKWKANVRANRDSIWAGQAVLRGLTSFVVCAGPSLEANAEELKKVGNLGVIICVDAALRHLMSVGVVPDYCMSIDSDGRCLRFTEGLDTSKITLVCMTSGSPDVINAWKGQKYFVNGTGGSADAGNQLFALTRKVRAKNTIVEGDIIDPLDDIEVEYPGLHSTVNCGGNVSTAAWSFAFEILRSCKVVFVGSDFSWGLENFYAGGHYQDLSKERQTVEKAFTHGIDGGSTAHTNLSLFNFKMWHESRAMQFPGTHVNASEGGILGIKDDGKGGVERMDSFEFLTLKEAVEKYTVGFRG